MSQFVVQMWDRRALLMPSHSFLPPSMSWCQIRLSHVRVHPEQTRFNSQSAYWLKGLDCLWANFRVMPAVTKKQLHGLTQLYWILESCGRIWQNELQLRMVSRCIRKRVHSNRDPVEFSIHPSLYNLVGQPQQQQVPGIWLKLSSHHCAIL